MLKIESITHKTIKIYVVRPMISTSTERNQLSTNRTSKRLTLSIQTHSFTISLYLVSHSQQFFHTSHLHKSQHPTLPFIDQENEVVDFQYDT